VGILKNHFLGCIYFFDDCFASGLAIALNLDFLKISFQSCLKRLDRGMGVLGGKGGNGFLPKGNLGHW